MATFEQFPYTDYQEYNLDWIIRKIKELEARQPKDYDDIIAEILRRLGIAETNIVDLGNRLTQLYQIENAHYLDLSQKIITVNNRVDIVENALQDLLQRVIALEDKVDGMSFRMMTIEEFERIPHLPGRQYWVYDDDNLQLWLGNRQLTFRAPNYQTVLTSIWNNNRYVGRLVLT
ncbi:hypothetical protein K0B41_23645, partial [Salmonella enterica subsp. enterica serovar Mbandaka]|nr:hypothetical protein [Salmonella enterica subsp. enterica serovar Mbandaka]